MKTQATPTSLWIVAASANTEAELAAAVARVRARHPERSIRVTDSGGSVVDTLAAAA